MQKSNLIQSKSFDFALKIIHLYKFIVSEKKEFILSKQLLRSGTSIGANIEEAIGAQTPREFIHKITISYREARETKYWLKLLIASDYLTPIQMKEYIIEIEEICRILAKILITSKNKNTE